MNTHILLLLGLIWHACLSAQNFITPFYFQDSLEYRDTVWIGFDPNGNSEQLTEYFSEINLIDSPKSNDLAAEQFSLSNRITSINKKLSSFEERTIPVSVCTFTMISEFCLFIGFYRLITFCKFDFYDLAGGGFTRLFSIKLTHIVWLSDKSYWNQMKVEKTV